VIVPALRAGGSYAAERTARSRRGALPGALQAGADLGLLVIAAVAYWQLHRRASGSGALSTKAAGGLGVDPVLVAAPALCLLAGTVLVLRLLPLAAKLGERRAARGRGLALALAGWQLARRPRRGASAALLLVLAVAMGMFAIGQGASWDRSQRDQAQYTVGADLRVTGMTTPPFGQAGIYASVPGVASAMPAARQGLLLTESRHATALAVDTRQAGRIMQFRSDLTGGKPVADVLKPLVPARSTGGGFTLPGTARKVTFTATLKVAGGSAGVPPDHLTATVLDAEGVPYEFTLGDLPADGAAHPLVLDLASQSGPAGSGPAGPLRLIRLAAAYSVPEHGEQHVLTLSSAQVTGEDGGTRPLAPAAGSWTSTATLDDSTLAAVPGAAAPTASAPHSGGPALMTESYRTGSLQLDDFGRQQPPSATLRIDTKTPAPAPLAAIATDSYLTSVGAKVGDSVKVNLGGVEADVKIAGSVRGVPGTGDALTGAASLDGSDSSDDASGDSSGSEGSGSSDGSVQAASTDKDAGTLVFDLRTVDRFLEARNTQPLEPTEWWLSARPGDTAKVAAALRARTDVDTVLVRDETAADLRADPLGAGPQSALPAAVVAAAVLAAVGFAVSSAGAIRERNAEFAVLRALGAPRRKLARMIAAEQGLLVLVSLAVGVGLGALLTRLVTPLIVLTAQATQPVPSLVVDMPVGRLTQLLAVVLVAPVLVVLATAVRRGDPAAALRRQGED
jgi:hypothetical protein